MCLISQLKLLILWLLVRGLNSLFRAKKKFYWELFRESTTALPIENGNAPF